MAVEEKLELDASQFDSAVDAAIGRVDQLADSWQDATRAADRAAAAMAKPGKVVDAQGNRFASSFNKFAVGIDGVGESSKKTSGAAAELGTKLGEVFLPENARDAMEIQRAMGGVGAAAGAAGAAVLGVGIALGLAVVAGAGVYALAKPWFEASIAANKAGDDMRASLDQVTGGRGEEALGVLSKLAKGLNLPVQDVTDQFIALRRDGIDNIDSNRLIALRADLLAVGVDAGTADAEIVKIKNSIKQGLDPRDQIKQVASNFGAVGDGANASADSVYTIGGALDKAANAGDRMAAKLGQKAAPVIDRVAALISNVVDAFENSGGAEKIIDGIVASMGVMVTIGEEMSTAIGPSLEMIGDAFEELGDAMGETTGESNTAVTAGQALGTMLGAAAALFAGLVSAAASAVSAFSKFSQGVRAIRDALGGMVDAVASFDLGAAGSQLVDDFINAIKNKIGGAVAAASDLGGKVVAAVKAKLGIASPSKVAIELGSNFGDSFNDAVSNSMPADIADAVPSNDNGTIKVAPAPGMSAGGAAPIVNVTVNVAGTNASGEDIAAATQRGVEQALRLMGVAS